jgi:G3E family GTPase
MATPTTPITIVTGFLGSGKTTLILNLLPQLRAASPSYRVALIKNEFGDVAVDSQLAGASAVADVRELLGGCICCNLVGSLGDALAEMAAGAQPPDRIIVETSGSAFPATLALEVNRLARETHGRYVLDGVVSVIDVENWKGYDDTSYTARVQARYTDLVVYNKWEACSEMRLDECRDRVGDLEVDVAWVKSDRGWVDRDVVFGIDGALAREWAEEEEHHAHEGNHDHKDHRHGHQSEVEVLSVELPGGTATHVALPSLQKLLSSAPKDEVYRIKGILSCAETPRDSDADPSPSAPSTPPSPARFVLNWAFGRWKFTRLADGTAEHESSTGAACRLTLVCARGESTRWKKKIEAGGLVEAEAGTEPAVVRRVV